jgi:hypothetical protein
MKASAHLLYCPFRKSCLDEVIHRVALQDPVKDAIGQFVPNPDLVLVVDSCHQVGTGSLLYHCTRNSNVPCEGPDLGLEQVAQRVDRWRVIGMPGKVPEQTFALVPSPKGECTQSGRLIPDHERAKPGSKVAPSEIADPGFFGCDIGIHRGGDRNQTPFYPCDGEDGTRVSFTLRTRCRIREEDGVHMLLPQRLHRQ